MVIKRVALAVLAVTALLAVGITILVTTARPSHALQAPDSQTATLSTDCKIGDGEYAGLVGFNVVGDHPVHFTDVEVIGVPKGLTVVGVQAVSFPETKQQPLGGASEAEFKVSEYAKVPLHPVTDVVLPPHTMDTTWWLLIKLRITEKGRHLTGGVKVSYTAGGHHGTTVFNAQFGSDCK